MTARITGPATVELTSGDVTLTGSYDGTGAELVDDRPWPEQHAPVAAGTAGRTDPSASSGWR